MSLQNRKLTLTVSTNDYSNRVRALKIINLSLLYLFAALFVSASSVSAKQNVVTVFAASSMAPALGELSSRFEKSHNIKIRGTYAASSVLAKQIYNGAPADIYISANPEWMSYLQSTGVTLYSSITSLVSNKLVLVSPKNSSQSLKFDPSLARKLAKQRIVIGDPDHVPAGIYAKTALTSLGIWQELSPRIVRTLNARIALTLVVRGEVAAGIVYNSDYISSKDALALQDRIPTSSHKPIHYPMAILKGQDNSIIRSFTNYLISDEAQSIFQKYGFTRLDQLGNN